VSEFDYLFQASYGNDSLALIQLAHERGFGRVAVLYNQTGWAAPWWEERVQRCEAYVRSIGFVPMRTTSIGMVDLVKHKRGWPRQGMQFCTEILKLIPTLEWLNAHDPECALVCLVGVRRAESVERRDVEEWTYPSLVHGRRAIWRPLVDLNDDARDALIVRAGFEILKHRSDECFPCINASRNDIRRLARFRDQVDKVRDTETGAGLNRKGKPRTMYRPAKKGGATGIDEIIAWAQSAPGQYVRGQYSLLDVLDLDDDTGQDCLTIGGGYCGI
jgi:3'-phosphoadenosine 5'-phosphosulfate sulfotransferase (PAPS reductase)/FAD synthetase